MPYKAILFDLDGTLLNTLEDLGDAVNRVLTRAGLPVHSLHAYRHFIGDGVVMLMSRALPEDKRNDETIRNLVEAFRKDYGENWNVKTKPFEGVPGMLDALVRRRIRMAVLSNKPHAMTRRCIEELLPEWTFEVVLGQRENVPRKPDPSGALEAADHLNLLPKQILYLGDSAVDMLTARAAGMFAVGALWGYRSMDELKGAGAQALIDRPEDVLSFLEEPR